MVKKTVTTLWRQHSKYLFAVIFMLFSLPLVKAQAHLNQEEFTGRWEIGIHGGTSLFFGDIKQNLIFPISSHVNEWRWAGGMNVGYQISPVFKLLLQGIYGHLSGTRRKWNMYFDAEFIETNLVVNVNFNNLFGDKRVTRLASVYGVLGIGLMQHNTEVKDLETSRVIKSIGYGSGSGINGMTIEGVVTYGLGFDFILSDHWVFRAESVNRAINTDRLDGYEDQFPFDVYNCTSFGFVYKFGIVKKKIKEIKVKTF